MVPESRSRSSGRISAPCQDQTRMAAKRPQISTVDSDRLASGGAAGRVGVAAVWAFGMITRSGWENPLLAARRGDGQAAPARGEDRGQLDRKSTRLNSSH